MATITHNNIAIETGTLAPRECAYFLRLACGQSAKQVARDLGVSHYTVEGACNRILYKLRADRMVEAVTNAWRKGLLRNLIIAALVFGSIAPAALTDNELYRTRTSQRLVRARLNRNTRRNDHV